MSYSDHNGPTTVSYTVVSSMWAYIQRCIELGAIEGPIDDHDLEPQIRHIVRCAHHILAGGEVEMKIIRKGNPDIFNNLESRMDEVKQEVNAVNKAAGYYVAGLI